MQPMTGCRPGSRAMRRESSRRSPTTSTAPCAADEATLVDQHLSVCDGCRDGPRPVAHRDPPGRPHHHRRRRGPRAVHPARPPGVVPPSPPRLSRRPVTPVTRHPGDPVTPETLEQVGDDRGDDIRRGIWSRPSSWRARRSGGLQQAGWPCPGRRRAAPPAITSVGIVTVRTRSTRICRPAPPRPSPPGRRAWSGPRRGTSDRCSSSTTSGGARFGHEQGRSPRQGDPPTMAVRTARPARGRPRVLSSSSGPYGGSCSTRSLIGSPRAAARASGPHRRIARRPRPRRRSRRSARRPS